MSGPCLRPLVANILAREIRERTQASFCGTFSGQNGSQVSPQVLLFPLSVSFHQSSTHIPFTYRRLQIVLQTASLSLHYTGGLQCIFMPWPCRKLKWVDTSHKLLNKTQIICARHYFTTTKSDNPLRRPFPSKWSHTPPIMWPNFQANFKYKSHFRYFSCLHHYGLIE